MNKFKPNPEYSSSCLSLIIKLIFHEPNYNNSLFNTKPLPLKSSITSCKSKTSSHKLNLILSLWMYIFLFEQISLTFAFYHQHHSHPLPPSSSSTSMDHHYHHHHECLIATTTTRTGTTFLNDKTMSQNHHNDFNHSTTDSRFSKRTSPSSPSKEYDVDDPLLNDDDDYDALFMQSSSATTTPMTTTTTRSTVDDSIGQQETYFYNSQHQHVNHPYENQHHHHHYHHEQKRKRRYYPSHHLHPPSTTNHHQHHQQRIEWLPSSSKSPTWQPNGPTYQRQYGSADLLNNSPTAQQNSHHQMSMSASSPPPLSILPIENVTATIGRTAVLKCVINYDGPFKPAWLKMDNNSEPTILTMGVHSLMNEDEGKYRVTQNERHWYLYINRIQKSDRGLYMCQINANTMLSQIGFLDVYEPPVINEELTSSDTTVDELSKVSLRCATNGYPTPSVTWRRQDGKSLNLGQYGGKKFAAKKIDGEYLNISQVNREDMGAYLCIASNGVPPSVSKRIVLQVNFRPKIRVHNQLASAYIGSDVELECRVEASPKPDTVWLTGDGQRLDELLEQKAKQADYDLQQQQQQQQNYDRNNNYRIFENVPAVGAVLPSTKRKKYQMDEEHSGYRTIMRLTIRKLEASDFGSYKCIAKNNLGEKEGLVRLYELPLPTLPPTTTTTTTTTTVRTTTTIQTKNPSYIHHSSKSNGKGMKEKWTNKYDSSNQYGGRSMRENNHKKKHPFNEHMDNDSMFDEDEYSDLNDLEDESDITYLEQFYKDKTKHKKNRNNNNNNHGHRRSFDCRLLLLISSSIIIISSIF